MRSYISNHVITTHDWVVSFIRRDADHCFILLEGESASGIHEAMEAHLGYGETVDGQVDKTKAKIRYWPTSIPRLNKIVKDGYHARTFHLTLEEKEQLINKIHEDQQKADRSEINYVRVGSTKTSGFLGASLDASGSTAIKEASIEKNHSLLESKSHSAHSTHTSIDAALRKGHNCTSWAIEAVKHVKPDFDGTLLSKLVAAIPTHEISSEPTGCLIM